MWPPVTTMNGGPQAPLGEARTAIKTTLQHFEIKIFQLFYFVYTLNLFFFFEPA